MPRKRREIFHGVSSDDADVGNTSSEYFRYYR
jgi:hypothetical protein